MGRLDWKAANFEFDKSRSRIDKVLDVVVPIVLFAVVCYGLVKGIEWLQSFWA